MGSTSPVFPCRLDLTKDPKALEQGTQEWNLMSQSVRDALETQGCLLVVYDKISDEEREELLAAMRSLFDLPEETKRRNSTFKDSLSTYPGDIQWVPLYEALGVMNAVLPEKAQIFTDLMWPQGNDKFCQTINSMSNKMLDVAKILMNMILDGYGLGRYYDSLLGSTDALFHMIKYSAPAKDAPALGLGAHTDVNYLTVLCQNEVEGLSIRSKEGEWLDVNPGKSYFVVFAGQSLRAWSNGRLHPPLHQVTFKGHKDRLTSALFLNPKPDHIVEVPHELVDKEHPPLFKPYAYGEFHAYARAGGAGEDILEKYCKHLAE